MRGEFVEAEAESPDLFGGDLDFDLLVGQALDIDLVDTRGEQFALEAARELAQFVGLGRAADQQAGDRLVTQGLRDARSLGVFRQIDEVVDLFLDLVEREYHVATLVELERNTRNAGSRSRGYFLEPVDAAQPLLERDRDPVFDILGIGPAPDRTHGYAVEFEIGEELHVELLQRDHARQDHHRHQQVGCDPVARKDTEQASLHESSA